MGYSPPGSSVHGILRARILEWAAISFSRGSSQPRDGTRVSSIAGRFFTIWATREASFSLEFDQFKGSPGECLYNIKAKGGGHHICSLSLTNWHANCISKTLHPKQNNYAAIRLHSTSFWLQGMCSLSLGFFLIIELNSQFFSMTKAELGLPLTLWQMIFFSI